MQTWYPLNPWKVNTGGNFWLLLVYFSILVAELYPMKLNRLLLTAVLIFSFIFSFSQKSSPAILLRSGAVQPGDNIRQSFLDSFNTKAVRFNNKTFALLQFQHLPSEEIKQQLSANGIELLEYIPHNTYTISINGDAKLNVLQNAKAKTLLHFSPQQKMQHYLAEGKFPSWAVKINGTIDCWISFPKTFSGTEVINGLKQNNIDVISLQWQSYRIIAVRIAQNRLAELASFPFVEFVQAAPAEDQPLNLNSRASSRANILNASVADGGKGLKGEGVVVGVGDNADVQTHMDFRGRLINRAAATAAGHGHHVTGTVAGAGNINEFFTGYAPKATIVSQAFSGILANAPAYVQDYGMVITNNSYGNINECSFHGTYDLYSRILDQQAFDMPHLQHIFAAGNSGGDVCPPYAPGFKTVYGGYQSAKNVLTVGASNDSGTVAGFSSKGPVMDGRLKPEMLAMGQQVASAWPTNIYSFNNGTSMAAPAAAGGMTLLYQRYRQLNGGANPKSGLIKSVMMNGATDFGNAGPDFSYGFGTMNLLRSVEMLDSNRYFIANIANGSTNTHTINVPANTAQLKVMLYWHDPAAAVLAAKTLVNDLDLEVVDPSSATRLPKLLDSTVNNLTNIATNGADHTNNVEQVLIDNPTSGNYTVRVKGAIAQNPSQEYFVVYDIVPVQLKITAPVGGQTWTPSTSIYDWMKISWEAYGQAGTVTLEYSIDSGATWNLIASGVNVNRKIYTWWVPNVSTKNAFIRVTKEGGAQSVMSNAFTILPIPVVSLAPIQCEGYIAINWTSVAGATDYEVMLLQEDEMRTIATTTANTFTFSGLSKDSVYWVTVRPRIDGKPGRRAVAISRQPNSGSCAGNISDNDLKLNAIISPQSGRRFTSNQLSAASTITVQVKNLDDAPVSNFTVQYSINSGTWITENVATTLAAGGTYNHSFASPVDLSVPGNYHLVAVVKNSEADPVTNNDTLAYLVKHLDNQPINLTTAFVDNIETASSQTYTIDTLGLNGLDRYDFENATTFGRLRTFINSGMAYSGSKALILDTDRFFNAGNTNYLYGTFNLSAYNASTNDIRLDFQYNNHGQQTHPNNKVWIRGNDAAPWIEAYDLNDDQADPGIYKKTISIEVADLLAANGQNFSSSFGVRWGQWGRLPATDKEHAAGYSFDDIRLYEVFNDIQMISIDTPVLASCGLTNAVPVKVSVRNSANTAINNIPVKYRINNSNWVTETIPSIAANSIVEYTFITPANLSVLGTYTIQAIVELNNDSFRENDTTTVVITNSPVITTFPYLQNFESGNAYWYAQGKNSSWQFGTPASPKINRAASGSRAWKTRLAGHYSDNELSYLYSPCFDVTGMTKPTLSISVALDLEDCGNVYCDGAWVEYSADGKTWSRLGAAGSGYKWYNKPAVQAWSIQNYTRWHVATTELPTGLSRLRLRFVMSSDPGVTREGIAIDDIHIYDNTKGIYDGVTMTTPATQSISGTNWIDLERSGKLVASIQANNQNLGTTNVRAFISDSVRNTNSQFYHNRNITIKPANRMLDDSVSVRFYFLDSETDSLIFATGCASCSKPSSAYDLGVSKYADTDTSFENGTVADNQQGMWSFIKSPNLSIVPFDKGYYAEFKVKDFSEFWLNNGGFDRSTPLPVKLMNFTAQKQINDVLLRWDVGSESNVNRYEIELARGNADLQAGHFFKVGEVVSQGNTVSVRNYSFLDTEADKFGVRYYRLKVIHADGSFIYSPVRSVVFADAVLWQVYPNPSKGVYQLVFQLNANDKVTARIFDAKGRLLKEQSINSTGFVQKLSIDIAKPVYPTGIYLLEISTADKKQVFKLFKQ